MIGRNKKMNNFLIQKILITEKNNMIKVDKINQPFFLDIDELDENLKYYVNGSDINKPELYQLITFVKGEKTGKRLITSNRIDYYSK